MENDRLMEFEMNDAEAIAALLKAIHNPGAVITRSDVVDGIRTVVETTVVGDDE